MRVLGPVTVRKDGDPAVRSHITQPRHLTLLCYLALARPRGLHERDTLVALLWPDYDEARGRRALRNALHGLRRRLGADAIISVGDHLVGLDPAYVSCDAVDLEKGARVPELEGGPEPFEGLHVAHAAGADQWMSVERDRLRTLVARRPPPVPTRADGDNPSRPRRPHRADAGAMYTRGHFLLLRTALGGSPSDLLLSRDYFERAHALDPTFAPALAGLANFYAVAGRRGMLVPFRETFVRVIDFSHQALALDDRLAAPHVHLAVEALYFDDDWDRAGAEFALAVANEPDYAEGHRFYGVWLGMVRQYAEALVEMELASSLEPDMPFMLSSLGAARLAVGDRVGAEAALRRTLSIDPMFGPARERLLRLLEDDARFEEAVAERFRPPALPNADTYRTAWATGGVEGYQGAVRSALLAQAAALEGPALVLYATTPNEIASPPIVRLVAIFARLGDWKRVRSWQLIGTSGRPALARWFASIPELEPGRSPPAEGHV